MKSVFYDVTNKFTHITFDETFKARRKWKGLSFYYYGINFGRKELSFASHGKSKQVVTIPYEVITRFCLDAAKARAGGEGQGMSGAPWSTSLEIKMTLKDSQEYGFYQYDVVDTVLQLEQCLTENNVPVDDPQNLLSTARLGKSALFNFVQNQVEHPGINIPKK